MDKNNLDTVKVSMSTSYIGSNYVSPIIGVGMNSTEVSEASDVTTGKPKLIRKNAVNDLTNYFPCVDVDH